MDGKRGSNCIGIIGTNNTGKTVVSEEIIKRFNAKRDRLSKLSKKYPSNYHKLVVFDVQNRYTKYMREGDINVMIGEDDWEDKVLALRDSLFIADDFKVLVGTDKISPKLLQIFGYRMEYGLDLVFIVWHPRLLPPRIAQFIDKYYLFRANGNDKEYVDRINGETEEIIKCKHAINSYCSKFTNEEYGNLYPNFPFVYYDTNTNTSIKVNMDKK